MKKSIIALLTALAVCGSVGLAACGGGADEHVHDWKVETSTATCGEGGVTTYKCECGETRTEEVAATGNHNYDGKVCSTCGHVNFSGMTVEAAISEYGYFVEDEDSSNTYSTGDTVYFGNYPRNMVEESAILTALQEKVGTLPTADNEGDWTGYGYYSEGEVSEYAFYKDVTVDGKKYRGVYLLDYRPYYSGLSSGEAHSYIDDEGYELETVYWFAYAPVQWKVLEYKNGSMFLASEYSLDAQPYQDIYEVEGSDYLIPETSAFVNDWEYSSLRGFLNGSFYDSAFDELPQSLIQTVTLDNSTTGYSADAEYQKNQKDTQDKVFLLSYSDVMNTDYGYSSKGSSRVRSYTDYATVQGLRTSAESSTENGEPACYYTLRSAGTKSYGVCGVSKNGSASYTTSDISDESVDGVAINGDFGVLPALYIRVGKAAQGVWNDFTYDETACSVYVPATYRGGDKLALVTYIADSSYATATLAQYKAAQCPTSWLTEEKMAENPALFLVITGSPDPSFVVSVVDKVVADYKADENRLYLTGQSMGGITHFAINDAYPDKFAATVYVDCQPGGEVHDSQYDSIIANAKFVNQKFVYIASRKDELASEGQDDVESVLKNNGVEYGKLYDLDHKDAAALNAAIKQVLEEGHNQNFFGFTQLTASGNPAAEHMASFAYGYSVDAIFEWLLAQHK